MILQYKGKKENISKENIVKFDLHFHSRDGKDLFIKEFDLNEIQKFGEVNIFRYRKEFRNYIGVEFLNDTEEKWFECDTDEMRNEIFDIILEFYGDELKLNKDMYTDIEVKENIIKTYNIIKNKKIWSYYINIII